MMAIEAFSAVGCDPTALRDYLETGFTDWPGVSGVFNITPEDHNGIGFESLALVQIKDGAFAYVPPEEYASVP
jgi:branched-chain amino acid transport system substrate-binding protein